MRIAIFNHPFSDFYTSNSRISPGVLEHLKKISHGHDSICFCVTSKKASPVPLPDELQYLSPYLIFDQSNYSFFTRYYRFGSVSNFDHKQLKLFAPQCFLVTSFAYCYFEGFKNQVAYLKKRYPKTPVICGGPGPSCDPAYYLTNSLVDMVVKGPAESVLPKLLEQIEQSIYPISLPGVFVRDHYNEQHSTIKAVPVVPFISYQQKQKRVQLQVTKGCPKKCAYCSIHSNSFGSWQKSSVLTILFELKSMNLPEDIHFNFEDDNLTFDKEYFLSLINEIKSEFPKATFSAENGIDFTTLDETIIDEMNRCGFTDLNLSLPSVSISTLKHHGRTNYLKQFELVVKYLSFRSIASIIYYICGLPKDSPQNVLNTLTYLMSKPVLIVISPFYPVPGTLLMNQHSSCSVGIAPVLSRGTSFFSSGMLSTAQMVTFFMFTRVINFLKSTNNKDWETLHNEKINTNNRKQSTQQAWIHSVVHGRLTGYRIEDAKIVFVPYSLDEVLSQKLFNIINGDIPLLNCNGEELDKSLWT